MWYPNSADSHSRDSLWILDARIVDFLVRGIEHPPTHRDALTSLQVISIILSQQRSGEEFIRVARHSVDIQI
jgi:hypothetical protein